MNVIKKYFTLKKVFIFFGLVFVVLFFAGGCSFKYMDWQYYKFKRLCKNNYNKINIYSKTYRDLQQRYREAMLNNRDIEVNAHNGIKSFYDREMNLKVYPANWQENTINTQKVGFGIGDIIEKEIDYYFVDSTKKVRFANFKRFIYIEKGLWIKGDEGVGFYWDTENQLDCNKVKN